MNILDGVRALAYLWVLNDHMLQVFDKVSWSVRWLLLLLLLLLMMMMMMMMVLIGCISEVLLISTSLSTLESLSIHCSLLN